MLQCSFYENLKNLCKNRLFCKKFKKVCVLQRRACTQIQNFKRNYLENYNDSEHAVKTKNAPFFMIFPNISFFHMGVTYWTGPLNPKNNTGNQYRIQDILCRVQDPDPSCLHFYM